MYHLNVKLRLGGVQITSIDNNFFQKNLEHFDPKILFEIYLKKYISNKILVENV